MKRVTTPLLDEPVTDDDAICNLRCGTFTARRPTQKAKHHLQHVGELVTEFERQVLNSWTRGILRVDADVTCIGTPLTIPRS
jgi:hypothetical protein